MTIETTQDAYRRATVCAVKTSFTDRVFLGVHYASRVNHARKDGTPLGYTLYDLSADAKNRIRYFLYQKES